MARVSLGIALIVAAPVCAWFAARQQVPFWIALATALILALVGIRIVTGALRVQSEAKVD